MTTHDTGALDAAAAAWLAQTDIGDARASWEASGSAFRDTITPDDWATKLREVRGPLGPLTSRTLAVEQRMDGIPGAPLGEYDERQYHSVYGGVHAVTETLTLLHEDGAWRVVGYFIR